MNLFFSEQSKELAVMATAALPIIELRGAIPFGIALGLTPTYTFLLSLFGSMIPVGGKEKIVWGLDDDFGR